MKIKTKKEQIREKIDSLMSLRKWNEYLANRAYRKWERKENWGFMSFIITDKTTLYIRYEHLRNVNKELADYEDMLTEMLANCN